MDRLNIQRGDITDSKVDAIVNAANTSLLGGGGVDGAIHRAAGPLLLEACRRLGGCPTGEAKITPGFNLKAKFVIHAVGPIWRGGEENEDELLASCYRNSLQLALKNQLSTIAFPAISCGVYGFPLERATAIALREIRTFLNGNPQFGTVSCVCFGKEMYDIYQKVSQLP